MFGADEVHVAELADAQVVLATLPTGCGSEQDSQQVAGKVLVVQRGDCTFVEKVLAGQRAGALAVIIYNHVDGAPRGALTCRRSHSNGSMLSHPARGRNGPHGRRGARNFHPGCFPKPGRKHMPTITATPCTPAHHSILRFNSGADSGPENEATACRHAVQVDGEALAAAVRQNPRETVTLDCTVPAQHAGGGGHRWMESDSDGDDLPVLE